MVERTLTGTVVDAGDGVTHIIPVADGYVIGSCIKHIPLAGRDITNFIQLLMRERETIADVLPSFDDFARRDAEAARPPPMDLPPTRGSYNTRAEEVKVDTVQDKMLQMLTFDGIDERPVRSERRRRGASAPS